MRHLHRLDFHSERIPRSREIELPNQVIGLLDQSDAEMKLIHCSDAFCRGETNLIL
jgi:hypothetical protein